MKVSEDKVFKTEVIMFGEIEKTCETFLYAYASNLCKKNKMLASRKDNMKKNNLER